MIGLALATHAQYEDEHLNFKIRHRVCVASATSQPCIEKTNP